MEIRVVADPAAAARLAADVIARSLRSAVRRRGKAAIAVSGGTTPALMLADLATADVAWHLVTVFQVDERVAPDGDPDRNLTMLDALSSTRVRIEAMPVTPLDLHRAACDYAGRLPERLDVVHLGLGDDGHTASWPPGDPVVDSPSLVAISAEYRGRVRMTLTPRAVNAARARLVLATGAAKAAPISEWLAGDRTLPIARVHRTGTLLVVDEAAAPAARVDQ
jgi:6-phosphogluconolactonase